MREPPTSHHPPPSPNFYEQLSHIKHSYLAHNVLQRNLGNIGSGAHYQTHRCYTFYFQGTGYWSNRSVTYEKWSTNKQHSLLTWFSISVYDVLVWSDDQTAPCYVTNKSNLTPRDVVFVSSFPLCLVFFIVIKNKWIDFAGVITACFRWRNRWIVRVTSKTVFLPVFTRISWIFCTICRW